MKVICKRRSGIVKLRAELQRTGDPCGSSCNVSELCSWARHFLFSAPLQVYMGATKLLGKPSFYGHLLRYTPFIAFMDNLLEMT